MKQTAQADANSYGRSSNRIRVMPQAGVRSPLGQSPHWRVNIKRLPFYFFYEIRS
ncbi:MAG: hypothetical protein ACI9MB_001223 [Verrucomicrobiales bacterium]|jgi:hypothetical protein